MRELRYSDYYASYEELRYGTTGNTALQVVPDYEEPKKKTKKGKLHVVKKQKPKRDLYTPAQVVRNRMTLMVTLVALALVCISCINYLMLQAKVSEKVDTITALENEYVMLKTDNDLTEVVINSTIDYDRILDVALNELGMVYAEKGQVITYESQEMECVKQFGDIPVK